MLDPLTHPVVDFPELTVPDKDRSGRRRPGPQHLAADVVRQSHGEEEPLAYDLGSHGRN